MRLHSELGQGTTVLVYLPRHGETEEQVKPPTLTVPGHAQTRGVVLLVEDQAEARAMTAEWLRDLGYEVLEAEDGPVALSVLARSAHMDMLVTDVGLPNGLNGHQVAEAARDQRQALPVLFITGYAGSALEGRLAPGMQILGKPFTLDVLADRIGSMLEKPAIA